MDTKKMYYSAKELRAIGLPKGVIEKASHSTYANAYMFKTTGGGKFIFNLKKLEEYLPLIMYEDFPHN